MNSGGRAPGHPPIPSSAMPYHAPRQIGGRDDDYGSSNWNEDNQDIGGDDLNDQDALVMMRIQLTSCLGLMWKMRSFRLQEKL
jgi:hypothetical protein